MKITSLIIIVVSFVVLVPIGNVFALDDNSSPPLKQLKSGVVIHDIVCREGLELVIKASNGSPSCVKPSSIPKLVERGWAISKNLEYVGIQNTCDKEPDPSFRISTDDVFLKIDSEYLHGFSGMFVDDNNKLSIYLSEPDKFKIKDIRDGLCGYVPSDILNKEIVKLKAPFGWGKWMELSNKISPMILQEDYGITLFDIDEKSQKLVIGIEVDDANKKEQIQKVLIENNIPLELVDIILSGQMILEE